MRRRRAPAAANIRDGMIRHTRPHFLFFALACIASGPTAACSAPAPGTHVHHDYVIWEAETIVLVRLKSRTQMERAPELTRYLLETVETIKGTGQPAYEFVSGKSRHSSRDFDAHNAREFWTKDLGRSEFPCCVCGPAHSFRDGEIYLYFPDQPGAMKSAELVRGAGDKWLTYVRTRVKSGDNPALTKNGGRAARRFYDR